MAEKSVSVVSTSAASGSMASMSSQAERGRDSSVVSQVLFHFFDEITRKVKIPRVFYWIANLYALIQVWGTSLWLWNGDLWASSDIGNIVAWFVTIGPIKNEGDALIISIIIPVAVVLIGVAMVVFQVINYAKMREFITWTLYPTRFCLELVALIVVFPTAVPVGSVLAELVNKMDSLYLTFLIILVVMLICCVVMYYITSIYVNSSAYLPASPFAVFSGGRMPTFYIANSALIMIHIIFGIYPRWANSVVMIAHLALCIYEAYKFSDRTLINRTAHITFCGFLYSCVALDVLGIVLCLTEMHIDAVYLFGIGVGALVIGIVGSAIWWNRSDKKMIKQLAYNQVMNRCHPDYKPSEEEQDSTERAERLKLLCMSKQAAVSYVMVGFANACDTFVDMSLIKTAVMLHQDVEMLTMCLKILVLFPGSYRLSNLMLADLNKYRGLGSSHQFIKFQVDKIRVTRQTSSSTAGAAKLKEMTVFVNECETKTMSVWAQKQLEYPQVRSIYTLVERTSAKCTEILNDFPNSTHHLEQHIRFLIECSTDFSGAIMEKHKTEMIEAGHSYAIDYAFKSMVRLFPIYLKRKIVDVKGEFIQGGRLRKDSTNASNGSSLSMSSSDTIDQAVEETIGKSLMNHSRTRLAFQEATRERKFASSYRLILTLIGALIGSIVLYSAMVVVYTDFFTSRSTTIQRDQQANRARLYLSAACLSMLLDYGDKTGKMDLTWLRSQWESESNDFKLIDVSKGYDYQAQEMLIESRNYFSSFLGAVTGLSSSLNVYSTFSILFSEDVNVRQCHKAIPTTPMNMTLRAIYTYALMNAMVLDGSNTTLWYETNNNFCNIFGSYTVISEAFANLRWMSCVRATEEMQDDQEVLDLVIIIVPVILGVVTILPIPILMVLLITELKRICKMIMGLEDDARKAAANPLMRGDDDARPLEHSETVSHDSSFVATGIAFALFAVLGMVSIVMFIDNIHTYNLKFEHVSNWLYYCTLLKPQAVEVIQSLAHLVFLSCDSHPETKAIDLDQEVVRINELTDRMQSELTDFLQDTEMVPTILGEHEEIDDVLLNPSCDITQNHDENYHEMYKCQTLNNMVVMFIQSASEVISMRKDFNCEIKHEKTVHLIHMMNQHLEKLLTEMDVLFDVLLEEYTTQYKTRLFMWFAFGLIAAFGMFIAGYMFKMYGDQAYQGAMMILRRVSPTGIVANAELMSYLLNRNGEKHHEVMTTTKGIIHNARDGIICTSGAGIIETVNTSVSDILGYIPAQILGQHMGIILDEEDAEKINNQMTMIVGKEAARVYKDTVTCLNDSNIPVQCSITLMGMESDRGDITSFVAVIKDITSLIDQQKEAEEAKARSEKLLYEILPRDIVNRIQQGEKDITFVVPSASIMFIDIAKFSEYASRLNPQEIMGNLSMIFGGYDALLPKYPLITKIKLIGDVYMAAAGLFEEVEPKEHASQMIQFAFEALNALEEVNTKLDAVLSVRIGVNTGGPIIAGVLGTDKPVFDIIGDPINIAARLQSTSIPNRIQISESTYEAIKDMEFSVEPRGEVFLKGKGMRPAYLVTPGIAFTLSSVLSSSQSGQISGPI